MLLILRENKRTIYHDTLSTNPLLQKFYGQYNYLGVFGSRDWESSERTLEIQRVKTNQKPSLNDPNQWMDLTQY